MFPARNSESKVKPKPSSSAHSAGAERIVRDGLALEISQKLELIPRLLRPKGKIEAAATNRSAPRLKPRLRRK